MASQQVENLERLRASLESNIANLRKSLTYWQTYEYEHEGLKEELERPEDEPTPDEMLAIGLDIGLDIVDEKELKSLLHFGKAPPRTRDQVLADLRGRIDHGGKSVATLRKQLLAAEEKLEKVLMVKEEVAEESEGGEQLMDIFEELDEEGNVISSEVVDANKGRKEIGSVLKENGLAPEKPRVEDLLESSATKSAQTNGKTKKVAFAQDAPKTSSMPRAPPANKIHPTQMMHTLDENDNVVDSQPLQYIHPRSASEMEEDDIAFAREARASAQEIAPIVASFDIEDDSEYDIDTDASDMEVDSEDEYGMSDIHAEMTDDYKKQMEALMQKHAVAMENAGPNYNEDVVQKLQGAPRDVKLVPRNATSGEGMSTKKASGKGVRFAEELDISSAPEKGAAIASDQVLEKKQEQAAKPVSEAVLERTAGSNTISRASATRKPSKFKTNMNTASNRGTELEDEYADSSTTPSIPSITTQELPERPKKMSKFKAAKMGA